MGGGISLIINDIGNYIFESNSVATGCSLGVDSFSTIEKYTSKGCPQGYKLTHLTFFNAGAYGSKNLDKARESYNHDLVFVKQFGERIGLPVIEIETNFALLYRDFPNYGDSGFLRNMSIVLSMQKFFKKYLYASTYQANDFNHGWGKYFYLAAKLFSTPNTDITITLPIQTRIDKTRMILNNPLSYEYLNVCWGYQYVDYGNKVIEKVKEKYLNCCRCDKCMRTMLTIDILGYKDKYSKIFDLEYYEKVKSKYLGKVIGLKHKEQYYKEIVDLLEQEHKLIPLKAKLYAVLYKFRFDILFKKIKRILRIN